MHIVAPLILIVLFFGITAIWKMYRRGLPITKAQERTKDLEAQQELNKITKLNEKLSKKVNKDSNE